MPLLLLGDFLALRLYWRQWNTLRIKLLAPSALIGVVVGTVVLVTLPDQVLRVILGVFTLAAVVYKLASDRIKSLAYHHHNWHAYLAGSTSGFGSAVANVGAPPFTAYMLLQKASPIEFIGTTTLFFIIVNLSKLPGLLITGIMGTDEIVQTLAAIPVMLAGMWLGRRFIEWVDPRAFDAIMTGMLVLAAVALLV